MCRLLGIKPTGGNYRIVHNAIKEFNLDTRHFTGQGWNVGLKFNPKKVTDIKDILVEDSSYQSYKLKNRLLKEGLRERRCECCGLSEWMGKDIPLELRHANGNDSDNRIENLLLLCPDCHALTDNYRGLNKSAHQETGDVELP